MWSFYSARKKTVRVTSDGFVVTALKLCRPKFLGAKKWQLKNLKWDLSLSLGVCTKNSRFHIKCVEWLGNLTYCRMQYLSTLISTFCILSSIMWVLCISLELFLLKNQSRTKVLCLVKLFDVSLKFPLVTDPLGLIKISGYC